MADEYWITGVDGKEYGPASLAIMAEWIREHRVVASSAVKKGQGPWMEARKFPELATHLGLAPVPAPVPGGAPAGPAAAPVVLPADFRVWELIGRAWDLVKQHWLPLSAMFFIQFAIGAVPYLGACAQFIIGGAIMVGIWRAILGTIDGRPPGVGMMFEGFDRFGDAFLGMLVRSILTALGFIALIVPGIFLAIMWAFTFPVLAETRLGFWEAMQRSVNLTEGYRWRLFLLALACIPVLLLGLLVLCVGVFVAEAVAFTAFGLAYRFLQQKKSLAATAGSAPAGPAAQTV